MKIRQREERPAPVAMGMPRVARIGKWLGHEQATGQ